MRENIQSLPMSEVAVLQKISQRTFSCSIQTLIARLRIRLPNLYYQQTDVTALRLNGLTHQDWVGNIFCEFTDEADLNEDELHKVLHEAAINIQYILPEYKETKL